MAKDLSKLIMSMLLFATVFTLIGFLLPRIYFTYFDDSQYYYILPNPLTVQDNTEPFKPCDNITYGGIRTSEVEFVTESSVDLIRVDGLTNVKIYTSERLLRSIERGQTALEFNFKLPCELKAGEYYLSSVTQYEVYNVTKTYRWTSETFIVK